jgi:hypothetical protein
MYKAEGALYYIPMIERTYTTKENTMPTITIHPSHAISSALKIYSADQLRILDDLQFGRYNTLIWLCADRENRMAGFCAVNPLDLERYDGISTYAEFIQVEEAEMEHERLKDLMY